MAVLGTRKLTVSIGGTDYSDQLTAAVITSGEADVDDYTMAESRSGGAREYKLQFTALQDLVAGTLWDKIFTGAGTTVAYLYKPYGNAVASLTEPHFSGNAIVSEPDGDFLGGEASANASARLKVECEWVCTGKPTRITA